jgi:hypothetical protein
LILSPEWVKLKDATPTHKEEHAMAEGQQLLSQGIALAQASKNPEARRILGQVVKHNPRSVLEWLWLASVVETREQQRYCLKKVLRLDPDNEFVRQIVSQVKPEQPQTTVRGQYFVGHQPTSRDARYVGRAITNVFSSLGYSPCYAEEIPDDQEPSLLLRICQQVLLSTFGVFDLSSGNANTYLELGIALGLNRPVIIIARDSTSLPSILENRHTIIYADPVDLEVKLSRLSGQGFPPAAPSAPTHCYFCGQTCDSLATPPDEKSYLVLNESIMLWRSLMCVLEPCLSEYQLQPTYLTDRGAGPALCDARSKVLASQLVLCHLGSLAGANSLLTLGMAIGSRTPWVLLAREGQDPTPSILRRCDLVQYTTLADLRERLADSLRSSLSQVVPSLTSDTENDETIRSPSPYWSRFEHWIDSINHATQEPVETQGRVRIVRYEGSKRLSESTIPASGLVLGRNPNCDVVVDRPAVSSHHFRIMRERNCKYFVEDLDSKNGTFLNGTRLSSGIKVEVKPQDVIRIPGARFLIWDDRPLVRGTTPLLRTTGPLPPILKIEIPDVSPPAYLNTWNQSLVLTVFPPDGRSRYGLEVQAYYPVGRIASELEALLGLPQNTYGLMIEDRLINDDETPLSAGIRPQDVLTMVPKEPRACEIPPSQDAAISSLYLYE